MDNVRVVSIEYPGSDDEILSAWADFAIVTFERNERGLVDRYRVPVASDTRQENIVEVAQHILKEMMRRIHSSTDWAVQSHSGKTAFIKTFERLYNTTRRDS